MAEGEREAAGTASAGSLPAGHRQRDWHDYYSEKRVQHHWLQLDLVDKFLRGGRILEIGPAMGLVTAALTNAGWTIRRRAFSSPTRSVFHVLEAN